MSAETKKYWQDMQHRDVSVERSDEFQEELPIGSSASEAAFDRRGFFKMMGLSAAVFSAACSRSPVKKVIPFLEQPEDYVAGTSLHYASLCGGCSANCGIVLKARDGRPIKVEGNPLDPYSQGGVCAVGQATVLSLYDSARAHKPSMGGKDTTWAELDEQVTGLLKRVSSAGGSIRIVTQRNIGPTAEAAIAKFASTYSGTRRVIYDTPSVLAVMAAHQQTHGILTVPEYRIKDAKVIVSIGADFLGTWVSPVTLTKQYASGRNLRSGTEMSKHYQFESKVSLTGSNADKRFTIAPSETISLLASLAKEIAAKTSNTVPAEIAALPTLSRLPDVVKRIAGELVEKKGEGIVICGSDEKAAQVLVNFINEWIGAYGKTVVVENGAIYPTDTLLFDDFAQELSKGEVKAAILWGVNIVYSHPLGTEIADKIGKLDLSVSTGDKRDETGSVVKFLAPDNHYLESWGDALLSRDIIGLRQPTINPLFDTRSTCESLLRWSGVAQSHYDFLRARWQEEVFPKAKEAAAVFETFWEDSLRRGHVELNVETTASEFKKESSSAISKGASPAGELELVLYEKVSMRDGQYANSGWLQELPDPISKVTWDNYACISPKLAQKLGIIEGAMVSVKNGDKSITLPALIEPGVHERTIAIAVGYGRKGSGPIGDGVGVNASPLGVSNRRATWTTSGISISAAGGNREFAKSQTESSMQGRPIVKEATLAEFVKNPHLDAHAEGKSEHHHLSMWSGHTYSGHHWGMVVDLSACTGCSACIVACQAENNIPIVGRDEVHRRREMHWMRIDRYFAGSDDEPEVVHQPMMCQHCGNAPCETVCPVLATVHSSEGLNQQAYNRCVGTRYCANNCPPKVRRFNWFEYPHEDPLERMVLNPDVVVRSRGVMEKCSMCVQRIQEGKAKAKAESRNVVAGDILTACEQSCPATAIVFGDMNDPESAVAKLIESGRKYRILEELNIDASVHYLAKIRNTDSEGHHG